MKKKSLARLFGVLFLVIAAVTIIASGILTYFNQTHSYHEACISNLQQLTNYLSDLIVREGPEFSDLKAYFREHTEEVQVPLDFRADLPAAKEAFDTYMQEHYNGLVPDHGITFPEMDDEAKRLYAIYRFEYWFDRFFEAADTFGLSYVYFIYPEEDMDRTMTYMFDPSLETTTTGDGRTILKLGDQIYEDLKGHERMWEAWETGTPPAAVDSINNEYGYVYTFYQPLVINGEKVGLICADISVDAINDEIISSMTRLVIVIAILFAVSLVVLYMVLKKKVLSRILTLEEDVEKYSDDKDPAIAEVIRAGKGSNDELGSLFERFAGMITSLDEYMTNLQAVTAEKERIGAELNVATHIQAEMLPRIFPAFPTFTEFDIYATMDPAKEVGGDFYDFFLVDGDHLALVIADVSGKGVPAALFMVIAKSLIKNRALMKEEPSDALDNVNGQLCEGNESGLFVTVWLAVIDLNTGHVLEANAGHEYPALKRKDGQYELIKRKHSPAVAVMEGIPFRQTEFDLNPGDRLFVYTDGVTEATNAHNELFGEERLLDVLNRNMDKKPEELLPAVRQSIDEFVGTAPQFDDITMLGFSFFGRKS